MGHIPKRNIITGLYATQSKNKNDNCNNYNSNNRNNQKNDLTFKQAIILICVFSFFIFIVAPIKEKYDEQKEYEKKIEMKEFKEKALSQYRFNLSKDKEIYSYSENQELSVFVSYDLHNPYTYDDNDIKFTLKGKGYPKETKNFIGTGIYFAIVFYKENGEFYDYHYLIDSQCKSGEEVEFVFTLFDLEPGGYNIKIFASDDTKRPAILFH